MHTNYSASRRHLPSIAGMSLLLFAAGCGSYGKVSGKVFYQGKPLPGGQVMFFHEKGAVSGGIQEDGSYSVDKVPAGPVKISVTGPAAVSGVVMMSPRMKSSLEKAKSKGVPEVKSGEKASKDMMERMMGKAKDKNPAITIPPKYTDPEKSGLTYTVGSGSQSYDIKLE